MKACNASTHVPPIQMVFLTGIGSDLIVDMALRFPSACATLLNVVRVACAHTHVHIGMHQPVECGACRVWMCVCVRMCVCVCVWVPVDVHGAVWRARDECKQRCACACHDGTYTRATHVSNTHTPSCNGRTTRTPAGEP